MSTSEDFRAVLRRAGLEYDGVIVADGKLHRFKASGDRDKNSWYVLHPGSPAAGAFGCWKRGLKQTWCERSSSLSQADWDNVRQRWQEVERERERAETERHAKARTIAAWILNRAKIARSHPYLDSKGVKNVGGLREYRGGLVLPLRDVCGTLHSLQFISANADKKFLSGGKVSGCFFVIAGQEDGTIVICEGYATGASIFEATGFTVACALNCGNLLAVSKALRERWPSREIIIAADNDTGTDGNPGLAKATEAAKSIRAKLALPQFKDVSSKPTDFNDLYQLEELDAVKVQIESAKSPKETDAESLQRLAALSPFEFDRCAESEAKALGVNLATLRFEVVKHRSKQGDTLQGKAVDLPDVELWPEPVDGAAILTEVAQLFSRYIVLPDGAGDMLALWAAHTHVFNAFLCSPRLNICSPEKGCGKSTLRDVVGLVVPRPLPTENLSVAVLFRLIDKCVPTILADEYDAWLKDNEELRGLLNAGHRSGGQVLRCEGDYHDVRGFNVFAPAVLCGIGALPGTLHDRSIVVRLERAKAGELRERFDSRQTSEAQILCRKLARWCADNEARIETCDPILPPNAFNRLADNWRPLFAIAEIAGGKWPQLATVAYVKLTSQEDAAGQSISVALLADIRAIFNNVGCDRIWTEVLCERLNAMEERPYAEMRSGQGINAHRLGKLLGRFKISSQKFRLQSEPKSKRGYCLEDFQEAFDRYLPPIEDSKRNTGTSIENIGDSLVSEAEHPESLFHSQSQEKPNNDASCSTVPLAKGAGAELPENEAEEMLL